MSGERVFLTGATGWVGPSVLASLVADGREVVALVRKAASLPGARTVVGDLADPWAFSEEIAASDAVVHLASPRSSDPYDVINQDIVGVGGMSAAWRKGPFVYVSSSSVHGRPKALVREDSPVGITRWYDMGKFVNEFQVREASGEFDLSSNGRREGLGQAVILRPTIYLGGDLRRRDGQMIDVLYRHVLAGDAFLFDSDEGVERYGFSYVGAADFGRAVSASLTLAEGGPYEIAGGFTTWEGMVRMLAERAGVQPRIVVRQDPTPNEGEFRISQNRHELDPTRFVSRTGWQPQQSLEELVDGFVAAVA